MDSQHCQETASQRKQLLRRHTYLDHSKADRVQEGWNIAGDTVCKHAADCQNIHCGSTAEPWGTGSLKETGRGDRKSRKDRRFSAGVPWTGSQEEGTSLTALRRAAGFVVEDLNTSLSDPPVLRGLGGAAEGYITAKHSWNRKHLFIDESYHPVNSCNVDKPGASSQKCSSHLWIICLGLYHETRDRQDRTASLTYLMSTGRQTIG